MPVAFGVPFGVPFGVALGAAFAVAVVPEELRTVLPVRGNKPEDFNPASICAGVFAGPLTVMLHKFGSSPVLFGAAFVVFGATFVVFGATFAVFVVFGATFAVAFGAFAVFAVFAVFATTPPRIFCVTRGFPLFFLRLVPDILLLGDKITIELWAGSERTMY